MYLLPAISTIWNNPVLKIGRWLKKRIRRRQYASLNELLPSLVTDIYEDTIGDDLAVVFLAISTGQKL